MFRVRGCSEHTVRNMRIIFLGTPEFSVPSLKALHEAGHEIVLVLTRPDARRGRGRRLILSAVKVAALEMGLGVYQPASVNRPDAVQRLRAAEPELGVVVAYGEMLSADLLTVPPAGFLNLHASLLPRYRGAAPVNWALIRGETQSGVSIVRMTPGLDAGPILAQCSTAIQADETAGELHNRLSELGAAVLADVVGSVSRGEVIPEQPQDPRAVSKAPKLTKKDGRVNWRLPASELRNLVRGLTPWPGAACRFTGQDRSEEVILLEVAVRPEGEARLEPGMVLSADDRGGIVVQAGQGAVEILRLKPASGRAMSGAEYVRGRRVRPGDRFA